MIFYKQTDRNQLLYKYLFHPIHTFQLIRKSQISRFFRICRNIRDFDEAWQILSHSLCKRNYSKRWLRHIKSKTVRELQIQQRHINPTNPENSQWGSKPCGISRCRSCEILCSCHNITSTVTNKTHGIIGNLNCSSPNIIY